MKPTLNEKFLAYLALLSGITLSVVAEYYSILGLTAIFAAAVLPVIVMGVALGIGKVSATLWLKQNWKIAPWSIRIYLGAAIVVLMMVTSMGTFGFLSKAHSDQSLVSGDVQSKVAIYDEKIKTAKESIESDRRQLKQMDEAVDQIMARSQDEKGADKANSIRKSQSRDRVALAKDIEANQKLVIQLNDEAAPIRAEIRKVEAEVGPIKYIAAFAYGSTDQTILERAVTWVIILIIVVFDPLAVILLLSSQISFQNFRKRTEGDIPVETIDVTDTEPPTVTTIDDLEPVEFEWSGGPVAQEVQKVHEVISEENITDNVDHIHCSKCGTELFDAPGIGLYCPNSNCIPIDSWLIEEDEQLTVAESDRYVSELPTEEEKQIGELLFDKQSVGIISDNEEHIQINGQTYHRNSIPADYVQNEEQQESNRWSNAVGATISREEYFKTSQAKLEDYVDEIVELVKDGKIQLFELHEPLLTQVKLKL